MRRSLTYVCSGMGEITKFVIMDRNRIAAFSNMVSKISLEAGVEQKIIQKQTEEALQKWENVVKRPINTLLSQPPEHRYEELKRILSYFRDMMVPLVPSPEKLEKSMRIASLGYEMLLDLM